MNTTTFRDYWLSIPKQDRLAFCQRVGASMSHLEKVACGHRPMSAELALAVERETGGAVRFERELPHIDISRRPFQGAAA